MQQVATADTIKSNVSDDFVKAAGRFALLFLRVTNRGLYPRTFVAFGTLEVEDSSGTRYEEKPLASAYAQFSHGTDIGADLNPDETAHVIAVYDIPSVGGSYRLVPGTLAREYGAEGLPLAIP